MTCHPIPTPSYHKPTNIQSITPPHYYIEKHYIPTYTIPIPLTKNDQTVQSNPTPINICSLQAIPNQSYHDITTISQPSKNILQKTTPAEPTRNDSPDIYIPQLSSLPKVSPTLRQITPHHSTTQRLIQRQVPNPKLRYFQPSSSNGMKQVLVLDVRTDLELLLCEQTASRLASR